MVENHTKKTLAIYWQHILKYKYAFFSVMFLEVAVSVAESVVPLYFKKFFDLLASAENRDAVYQGLKSVLFVILLLELLKWVFWRIIDFVNAYFQSHVIADLYNTAFKYLHKHSISFFNDNFAGSLVKRVNYFARSFESIADKLTFDVVPLFVNIITITVILYFKNPILSLGLIAWAAIFIAINVYVAQFKLKYDFAATEAQTAATGHLADTISNSINVKMFNGYQREVEKFAALNFIVRRLLKFAWNMENFFRAIQALLVVILEIGIFYIGIQLWHRGLFTVGDFVLLQSYVLIVIMKIWNFGNVVRRTYKDLADAEEMTMIFETPHEVKDVSDAKELKIKDGVIEFKNVDFYYHSTRKVLKKLNLTIASHERIALIGPSGAGKTTIIKLLMRNYDLTSGKILIDGQKISRVTQESLWQNISLVPQDPILFHRSLMDNIRYGKPEAADDEVIAAAKLAHCHEFIQEFPEQYNTFVGERGVKLSGGERQRVAIARAILRNAPILVLDEATSSLDSGSERLIQDALDKLMADKTVIVIAHRLSTIRKMHRIIFIDDGTIKEEGSHEYLIKQKNSLYNKLWKLQAGGFMP